MTWLQLTVTVVPERIEPLEDALVDLGAVSVTFANATDIPILEPLPGQHPLWSQLHLTALFYDDTDEAALREQLDTLLSDDEHHSLAIAPLEDQTWERAWMDHYHPMQFGPAFWVVPHHVDPPDPNAINLRLDPGLAFGTGTHQTTAQCLEWLAARRLNHHSVLDFGCGSGVLGVAAALLGAATVNAVDIDPQAIRASNENAERNGVADTLNAYLSDDYRPSQHDVVVANILLNPLIELKPLIVASLKPNGQLAMTGLIARDASTLIDAYHDVADLAVVSSRDDWVLVAGQLRNEQ